MNNEEKEKFFNRSELVITDVLGPVNQIIENVKENGDKAIYHYNREFDRVSINEYSLKVSEEEFIHAEKNISCEIKSAID